MRVLLAIVLIAGLMGAAPAHAPVRPVTHEATLILVFEDGGRCSGTAVGEHVLISAGHCFTESPLKSINGQPTHMVNSASDGQDHTLAVVDIGFPRWATIGGKFEQGAHISFWGNPLGAVNFYREGYMVGEVQGWTLFDVPVAEGDSGSGIFGPDGRLISVVSTVNAPREYFHLMGAKPLAFTREQLQGVGL